MRYLILIITFVLACLITDKAFGQIQKPDTLQLTPKELFGESGDLNNLGILKILQYSLFCISYFPQWDKVLGK